MIRTAIAVVACILLIALDYYVVVASFVYRPESGDLFALMMLVSLALALALRRPVLVYMVQAVVILPMFYFAITRWGQVTAASIVLLTAIFLLSIGLAWLVVRGLPQRSWFRSTEESHSAAGR